MGTFSCVARIEGLLAIRPSIVGLHCLLGSAAAAWRHSRNTGEVHLDSVNLDHRHLRAGMAATPAMILLPHTTAAMPDTKTTIEENYHDHELS
jgi:hypothetical protein